jgi:hypothetical protein
VSRDSLGNTGTCGPLMRFILGAYYMILFSKANTSSKRPVSRTVSQSFWVLLKTVVDMIWALPPPQAKQPAVCPPTASDKLEMCTLVYCTERR